MGLRSFLSNITISVGGKAKCIPFSHSSLSISIFEGQHDFRVNIERHPHARWMPGDLRLNESTMMTDAVPLMTRIVSFG